MSIPAPSTFVASVVTPPQSQPLRVTVVDDDFYFQQTLIAAVESAPDMELNGVAATLAGALSLLERPPSHVLLIDLGLPDGSGIDMIRATRAIWPDCGIMACTALGDEAHVMSSIEVGASGYLLKDSTQNNMLDEIRDLHAGGSPISPLIARQILMRFRKTVPVTHNHASPDDTVHPHLSEREQQVLHLVTRGFTAKEISELLKVSHNTVLTYVRRVYSKLNVRSKAEAIYEAQHRGLLPR